MSSTADRPPALVGISARSPIGAAHGALSGWHPIDLLAHVLDGLRDQLASTEAESGNVAIDRLVVANATPVGALSTPLRSLALAGHWSGEIPGVEIGGASLAGHLALAHAAELVGNGLADNVIVCGVDMASVVPPGAPLLRRDYGKPLTASTVRELTAAGGHLPDGPLGDSLGFNRSDLDALVLAAMSTAADWPSTARPTVSFINDPERTTPYQGPEFTTDEPLRRLVGSIGDSEPIFDPDGVITAWSLAQPGDGAVAMLVSGAVGSHVVRSTVREAGSPLDPVAPMAAAVNALGSDDSHAPPRVFATAEPTAAHTLALAQSLGIDPSAVNPHGGATARGRLDGVETLQGLHDIISADPNVPLTLLSSSGDGGAAATFIDPV